MVVTEKNIDEVLLDLLKEPILSFDTETTGLRPYHDDYAFCATIASEKKEYFFSLSSEYTADALDPIVLKPLVENASIRWVLCSAKFDMAMLARFGLFFAGQVCELQAAYRLLNNEAASVSLSEIAKYCGYTKSDAVENYIKEHALFDKVDLPHVKRKRTDLHFDKVPASVLMPYALNDARITFDCFKHIMSKLSLVVESTPESLPNAHVAFYQELDVTKVLFHMERRGVLVDRQFCVESAKYYEDKIKRIEGEFLELTGKEFAKAPTLFREIFAGEEFEYTDKGNEKFDKKAIAKFKHPAAKLVVEHSAAKKQIEYFYGFLFHIDQNDVLHTRFNQAGTVTGRLSSSEMNLQNLTRPDKYEKEGLGDEPQVREAIVARPGCFFAMLDYEQIEYRVMLDMAKADGLIAQVKSGLDVHEATAKNAGVTRSQAKTVNFLTLYGGGIAKLAEGLNCTEAKAKSIQDAIFRSAPEIKNFIRAVIRTAEARGYVFNHKGRRYHFADRSTAYRAPNHLIQGTCSEILKEAMIRCAESLVGTRSRLLLSIHDELVFEIPFGEEHLVQKLKAIMEMSYRHKQLPMAVDVEVGLNLADKRPFSELASLHGVETRDIIQRESTDEASGVTGSVVLQDSAGI